MSVVGQLEASSGASLIWGKILAMEQGRNLRVETRSGRWVRPGAMTRDCVVLVQQRGSARPFVLALEYGEVQSVVAGLTEWLKLIDGGLSDDAFAVGGPCPGSINHR